MARPTNEEIARRKAAQAESGQSDGVGVLAASDIAIVAPSESPLDLDDDIARIQAMRENQPFGAFDRKLAYPSIEGYAQHWFNDKPGRIDVALRAGWTHVLDTDGKPKKLVVDSGGLVGYLMKIPEQFRAEDIAREQAKATAALAAVKKKPDQQPGMVKPSDRGAFYTPEGKPDAATITRS